MTKCNGDCNSCPDKPEEEKKEKSPTIFPFNKEVDISSFLEPIPKPQQDDTPLDYPCKCDWNNGETKRYMCLPCIKTWVEAVSFEDAMKEANRLEEMGKRVAAERVRETSEHKKWKGKINENQ